MKKILFFCMVFIGVNLFAQDLDGVYFQEFPKRVYFFSAGRFFRTIPKRYMYVYLRNDSTLVYIHTMAGGLGGGISAWKGEYIMKGDSIFTNTFSITFNDFYGTLINGELCFLEQEFKKAKLSDVEEFIEKYGSKLKNSNVCFQDGYALPCDEEHERKSLNRIRY